MLLAIEQGNTNTLFAIHDGSHWIAQWRAATDASRTADEYAVWLMQLLTMAGLSRESLDRCIISSVVPQSIFHLRNLSFHLGCNQGLNPFLVAVMVHPEVQVLRHLVHNLGHRGQLLLASLG